MATRPGNDPSCERTNEPRVRLNLQVWLACFNHGHPFAKMLGD
jgi:hypothetical protein